ncbi:hypothetical protein L1887_51055 [Cichorium endivia]|nr:hypothetical protein L1887_51055 [Cichorium endivia]
MEVRSFTSPLFQSMLDLPTCVDVGGVEREHLRCASGGTLLDIDIALALARVRLVRMARAMRRALILLCLPPLLFLPIPLLALLLPALVVATVQTELFGKQQRHDKRQQRQPQPEAKHVAESQHVGAQQLLRHARIPLAGCDQLRIAHRRRHHIRRHPARAAPHTVVEDRIADRQTQRTAKEPHKVARRRDHRQIAPVHRILRRHQRHLQRSPRPEPCQHEKANHLADARVLVQQRQQPHAHAEDRKSHHNDRLVPARFGHHNARHGRHDRLHRHERDECHARLDARVSLDDLGELGHKEEQQEEDAAGAERLDEHARHGADGKQAHGHERQRRHVRLDQAKHDKDDRAEDERDEHVRAGPRVLLAAPVEAEEQQHGGGEHERGAEVVDLGELALYGTVDLFEREEEDDADERDERDGHGEDEAPPPTDRGERASDERASRVGERDDDAEQALVGAALAERDYVADDDHDERDDAAAKGASEGAEDDELCDGLCGCAERAADEEAGERKDDARLAAKDVAEPAVERAGGGGGEEECDEQRGRETGKDEDDLVPGQEVGLVLQRHLDAVFCGALRSGGGGGVVVVQEVSCQGASHMLSGVCEGGQEDGMAERSQQRLLAAIDSSTGPGGTPRQPHPCLSQATAMSRQTSHRRRRRLLSARGEMRGQFNPHGTRAGVLPQRRKYRTAIASITALIPPDEHRPESEHAVRLTMLSTGQFSPTSAHSAHPPIIDPDRLDPPPPASWSLGQARFVRTRPILVNSKSRMAFPTVSQTATMPAAV